MSMSMSISMYVHMHVCMHMCMHMCMCLAAVGAVAHVSERHRDLRRAVALVLQRVVSSR